MCRNCELPRIGEGGKDRRVESPFLKCIPFFSSIKTIASSRVNSLAAVNSFENYVGRERSEREKEKGKRSTFVGEDIIAQVPFC